MPDSKLFLLYSPGADDPLGLSEPLDGGSEGASAKPNPRATSRISAVHDRLPRPYQSRVIELDCRNVAPYLLETHPGLDDPLLEQSISFAARYAQAQPEAEQDEPHGRHVAGWLVSSESAQKIASRFAAAAAKFGTHSHLHYGQSWCDPRMVVSLWSELTREQRKALVGENMQWIAIDAIGRVVTFSGEPGTVIDDVPVRVNRQQSVALSDSPAVLHLLEDWRSQRVDAGTALPANAVEQLHRHVRHAREAKLDGEDLRAYVLLAVTQPLGFETHPDVQQALANAAQNPDTLAQTLPAVLAALEINKDRP